LERGFALMQCLVPSASASRPPTGMISSEQKQEQQQELMCQRGEEGSASDHFSLTDGWKAISACDGQPHQVPRERIQSRVVATHVFDGALACAQFDPVHFRWHQMNNTGHPYYHVPSAFRGVLEMVSIFRDPAPFLSVHDDAPS
jgi:hypothetical protein